MNVSYQLSDLVWMLLCAGLVMLMQAGFCCLESGLARAKNRINVAIKNLFDFCVASIVFWLFGFGVMCGASWYGLAGTSHFMIGKDAGPWLLSFFLFQLVFCGTATTIISGAVAERIRFTGYVAVSIIVSALFYPLFGHWAWGGLAEGAPSGWLARLGFVDFAGSTVVHSVGGWISLAAVLIVGPRLGRFDSDKPMHGSDLPMATLGVFLLWFGWFGFNGGSTLAVNDQIPLILVNTNLAAATGGATALAVAWMVLRRPDAVLVMNGVLGGLVGITAGCHLVSPGSAVLIGAAAGVISVVGTWFLEWRKIDDVVGAVPVHAFCGVWGTLAVALLADPAGWAHGGGRWTQLWIQFEGVATCFVFAFGGGYVVLWLLNRLIPLRARANAERIGLNVSEHQARSEMLDLLTEMELQRHDADFSRHVTVEPHTEMGQIALQYNRVLDKVHSEITSREEAVEALRRAEEKYRGIFENAIEGIFQTSVDGHYLSANPALARIYGYDSPDALRSGVQNIERQLYVDPRRRYEFLRLMDRDGTVTDFKSQVYRRDGNIIWISENAHLVRDPSGKPLYYEGTVTDITEHVQTDDLRREKEAAEAACQAKSQFLANMSHEIRTPLNGVIGMLDLLTGTELSSKQHRYAQIAKSSADTLLSLINQILDFSKIEAGKLELESIDFNLRMVMEDTIEMFVSRARKESRAGLPDQFRRAHLAVGRPRSVPANRHQSGQQRDQVHRAGRSRGARHARKPDRHQRRGAAGGDRHRHWYLRGSPRTAFSVVLARRRFDHAPLRRHRARPGDHPHAGRADGRTDRRRQPPRPGFGVLVHAGLRQALVRTTGRARIAARTAAAAHPGAGRQCDQPGDPPRTVCQLGTRSDDDFRGPSRAGRAARRGRYGPALRPGDP